MGDARRADIPGAAQGSPPRGSSASRPWSSCASRVRWIVYHLGPQHAYGAATRTCTPDLAGRSVHRVPPEAPRPAPSSPGAVTELAQRVFEFELPEAKGLGSRVWPPTGSEAEGVREMVGAAGAGGGSRTGNPFVRGHREQLSNLLRASTAEVLHAEHGACGTRRTSPASSVQLASKTSSGEYVAPSERANDIVVSLINQLLGAAPA